MAPPGQKWVNVTEAMASRIKEYLLREDGVEDDQIDAAAEVWRVRFSDATITYYKSGTLYSTDSNDPAVKSAWEFIESLLGSRFEPPTKEILIGLDETGKGEVIGHTVLVGVLIPASLTKELEALVSVADTKKKRGPAYWDDLFMRLEQFKSQGLQFQVERIPPWHVDRYNLNKIMDVVYQRILSIFSRHAKANECRIVVDDYGVGDTLRRYLRALKNAGSEVVIATGADDRYLESRVASVLAKRDREKAIETLRKDPDYQADGHDVGSGNAGDPETVAWLSAWKKAGKPWPWFVKQSFSTIRKLDGLTGNVAKQALPIREDILSKEFLEEFHQGRLSVTSLSIVCSSCGTIAKAALVTPDSRGTFVGRCLADKCKKPIPDLGFTLRYYCGYVLPDSNIITGGLLSKYLERSRFFEGFTVLLHATVRRECDTPGGKAELGKLANFAAIGRIGIKEVGHHVDAASIVRDEAILESALRYNAILMTDDKNMKAAAQARQAFVLST